VATVLLTDDDLRRKVYEEVIEADDELSIREVHIVLDALVRVTETVSVETVDLQEGSDG
jgi:hypothetical protein